MGKTMASALYVVPVNPLSVTYIVRLPGPKGPLSKAVVLSHVYQVKQEIKASSSTTTL
jgi:hypothetical protein